MIDLVDVGMRICEKRKIVGLTQVELAEKLNVSHQAVSKWETGLSLPDAEILLRLADLFETSIEYLLTGQQDRETIERNYEGDEKDLDLDRIIAIAPIVDTDVLSALIARSDFRQAKMYHLHSLAPFASTSTLENLILSI